MTNSFFGFDGGLDFDSGLGLNPSDYDLNFDAFSNISSELNVPFEAGFDVDLGLGIDYSQFNDLSNIFEPVGFTPQQQQKDKSVKPGNDLFSLPSILNMAGAAMKAFTAVERDKFERQEAERQDAEAKKRYWAQVANQQQENLRNYEYQLDSYYKAADYVEKRRQYEAQLQEQQAQYKSDVAVAATNNFARQLADLEGRFYEEEARDTIALDNLRLEAEAKAARVASKGQAGRTVQALKQQYDQQYLANLSNRQITTKFRVADKLRAGEAANVARENQISQVRFYTPQPIADPVKPLAPLPIQIAEPTPTSKPSSSALGINLGSIALEAFNNYQAMQPPQPQPIQVTS